MVKSAEQLKHMVEDTSFLGHFTKEHGKFLTEKRAQQRREETAVPPWIGYGEEEEMKKQILALALVRSRISILDGWNLKLDLGQTKFPS